MNARSILIVEDNDDIRVMLKEFFNYKGFEVTEAKNGAEGIQKFRQINPQIVITDILMPHKTGLNLLDEIKDNIEDKYIVVMTGDAGTCSDKDLLSECKIKGVDLTLKKPFDLEGLHSLIIKVVKMNAKKVLIVDDNSGIQMMLEEFFGCKGYEVVTATNGLEGIEKYKEFNPEIVLTDIFMPKKTGLSLLNEIKNNQSETYVVVMTGGDRMYSDTDMIEKSYELGANLAVTKPFDLGEIYAEILKNISD